MVRFLKVSITQLLCLTAVTGAVLFMACYDLDEPVWWDGLLKYETPQVPRSFELIDRSNKPVIVRIHPTHAYEDGKTLFLDNHRRGWEAVRRDFFQQKDWLAEYESFDFYDEYDYSKLSFRGITEHFLLAQFEGREQCRRQLQELLFVMSESEIRRQLAWPRIWRYALPCLVIAIASLILIRSVYPSV